MNAYLKFVLVSLMIVHLMVIISCNGKPKGRWWIEPENICTPDSVRMAWALENATEARISPNVGEIELPSGLTWDDPTTDTEYTLEAKNEQSPWIKIEGAKKVNVVEPGDRYPIQVHGVFLVDDSCEWKTTVPETELSSDVLVDGIYNNNLFTIDITHMGKTGTVNPGILPTHFFDGDELAGQWIFSPTDWDVYLQLLEDSGDSCLNYPIGVSVGMTCKLGE